MELRFLGTGASGGTPGRGRSRRRESSALVSDERTVLMLDVTRDFAAQARHVARLDAILLTHGHRDATGGLPALRGWWLQRQTPRPIDVFLNPSTARIIRTRYRRLDHCRLRVVAPGRTRTVGSLAVAALAVPHSHDPRFQTYAWRVSSGSRSLVYASDVARLTPQLEQFCAGASILVLDGAMWRKRLFSHLTIEDALPTACTWRVESIILTQIGRTAPPHPRLQRAVAALCPRARPAYDELMVTV